MDLPTDDELCESEWESEVESEMFEESEWESEVESEEESIKSEVNYKVETKLEYKMRPVKKEDIESDEIMKYDNGFNFTDFQWDRETLNEYFRDSICSRIIRAEMDYIHPIIGLMFVTPDEDSYHVGHISVHSKFRRQGLASMMLEQVSQFISEDNVYNFEHVRLCVYNDNKEARNLYEKIGFDIEDSDEIRCYMKMNAEKFVDFYSL